MADSTLDMFLDDQFPVWNEAHIKMLRTQWKKMDKSHRLFSFNHDYHCELLAKRNDKALMHVIDSKIPHLSDFAREVALRRGLIK